MSGALRDAAIDAFFVNDGCVRESGHDTTFRWFRDGQERCTDFATVDLNSLLLQYELDIAHLYFQGSANSLQDAPGFNAAAQSPNTMAGQNERAQVWCQRARERAALFQEYLWNEATRAYFDYDTSLMRQSTYLAATTLYPLAIERHNECNVTLLSQSQAQRLVDTTLPRLEPPGGLLATAFDSLTSVARPSVLQANGVEVERHTPARQWEAPNGWAPHQMLAWKGLLQHGFVPHAQRLAYRWLLLIAENAANFHGTVPEKFDVVARTHSVFAEYGNVNADFAHIATEGFGWMNASFLAG